MTIGTSNARIAFNGDGVTTVFPINLQSYLATDFVVTLTSPLGVQTTLILNSDYSLVMSGTLSPTYWTLTTTQVYAIGTVLQVIVNPVQTQQTAYVQGQAFPSSAVQTNLDRLTQMIQRLQDQVWRSERTAVADVDIRSR